ncbi:MAG: ABC transporter permease [Firmicutes bacterium]|nr:ABC transporter permease [Bacillota bacterium]
MSTQNPVIPTKKTGISLLPLVSKNAVPILFAILCTLAAWLAKMDPWFLASEIITRLARNSLLVLALLIPVSAGLGLNFAIVLGAMAGQTAVIAITHYKMTGLWGFVVAMLASAPLAALLGYLAGKIMNRAKGREMITSMILGFFVNGLYQLVFLFLIGPVIPMQNRSIMLPSGVGIRNTVDLFRIEKVLDKLWRPIVLGVRIPMGTLIFVGLICAAIHFLMRTRLGQQMRTVGQDMHIAGVAGIDVDRTRIIAMIISTVIAAWGQLIFLQNISTLNTYNSHEQVGTFAVAALLVGGATARRATIWQAIVGVLLFHTLFIVSPQAGHAIIGVPQIGEYFRVFVAYGVIGVALALHAWQSRKS